MGLEKIIKETEGLLAEIPIDFGGGCSVSKASLMAWLIKKYRIKASIDIGIYRGRSFFPQALAHQIYTSGMVYGVDPYTKSDAIEFDNKEFETEIKDFVSETNFENLYKEIVEFQKNHKLGANSKIVRKTSAKAIKYFEKNKIRPGLIHIDGNHDTHAVMEDLKFYYNLLPDIGFIILDDVSWTSVKPATGYAHNELGLTLAYCRVDQYDDFSVFAKGIKGPRLNRLRANLAKFSDH